MCVLENTQNKERGRLQRRCERVREITGASLWSRDGGLFSGVWKDQITSYQLWHPHYSHTLLQTQQIRNRFVVLWLFSFMYSCSIVGKKKYNLY